MSSPRTRRLLRTTVLAGALVAAGVLGLRHVSHSPTPTAASSTDDAVAASGLDPELRDAFRAAAADAEADGIELVVNSGWRSPEHQQRLLDEAIERYGSEQEARRWVATPETSPHVAGDALDIGPAAATAWLAEYGAAYGLCRVYANEPWHYELRPTAVEDGCPPLYADASEDPRLAG